MIQMMHIGTVQRVLENFKDIIKNVATQIQIASIGNSRFHH